jgi:tetratricopeptide (TPR) repeat protein
LPDIGSGNMAEKTLAELSRDLRELYEKGNAALQKRNYDYAIAIYNQILSREPGFYPGREALRSVQFSKAGPGSSGGGFFKKVFGTASASPLIAKAQVQLRTDAKEALATCEQILNSDPNNTVAHKTLAEAALALGLVKTAVLSLEIAFKNNAGDVAIGQRLGEALTKAGQISRATAVYTEIQKAAPHDQGIALALKNLAARKTMSESGYEALESGAGSYRDILKDQKQAVALEQENRQVKSDDVATELIREYQQRLEQEPNNKRLLRSIAELYAQRKEFDTALEYYNQITTVEGQADPTLEKAIADTKLRKLDHEISLIPETSADADSRRKTLQTERVELAIADARRRVEHYPNDLAYRFELGQILFESSRISEAIQEFQKAQNNPNRKVQSLYYLGKCHLQRGMPDLAARALQNAITEKVVFDEEKKELIYTLGTVFEKQGKTEDAIAQYKLIYEVDIGFKDVAAKVDAYYASPGH